MKTLIVERLKGIAGVMAGLPCSRPRDSAKCSTHNLMLAGVPMDVISVLWTEGYSPYGIKLVWGVIREHRPCACLAADKEE